MILILTEAGDGIGLGHLTRMMALGEALQTKGGRVQLIVEWAGPVSQSVLENRRWVACRKWRGLEARELHDPSIQCFVIDSYLLKLAAFESIATLGVRVVAVDDFYRLPYPCHSVVNPNVFADCSRYLPSARTAIGGGKYVILRDAFRLHAGSFEVRDQLHRILVTLGGSDVHGIGVRVARALAGLGFEVVWVTQDIAALPQATEAVRILGHQCAEGLIGAILECDLVISGGGQTLHELACLGAPCVAIEMGEDQRLNLEHYERVGLLGTRLLWSQTNLEELVILRVIGLQPAPERFALSQLARSQMDGTGVFRVAEHVLREGAANEG